jgi:hypothetical protein
MPRRRRLARPPSESPSPLTVQPASGPRPAGSLRAPPRPPQAPRAAAAGAVHCAGGAVAADGESAAAGWHRPGVGPPPLRRRLPRRRLPCPLPAPRPSRRGRGLRRRGRRGSDNGGGGSAGVGGGSVRDRRLPAGRAGAGDRVRGARGRRQ